MPTVATVTLFPVVGVGLHLHGDTRCSQASRLHATCHCECGQPHDATPRGAGGSVRIARPIRRAHCTSSARTGAITVGNGNVDVAADEADVNHDGDEGGSDVARKAADKEDADERVYCAYRRDSFDGLDVRGDCDVVVHHGGEEVCVDAHDDDGAYKFNAAEKPLEALEAGDVG